LSSRGRVGIVGLGQIGGGLAELLADQGVPLTLYARRPDAAEAFRAGMCRRLERRCDRGRLPASALADFVRQVRVTRSLSEFHDVDVAVEAVSEDLTAKRSVLAELSRACPERAILASTTSELLPETLGDGLPASARLVGTHFLSPVRLTTVVEIIRAPQSAAWVVAEIAAWCRALGKRPFVFRRSVVNRLLASYIAEGLSACVATGAAPEAVDARMLDAGMSMGPLATLDLVGIDVALDVFAGPGSALVADDGGVRRILAMLRAEGHLGRKSKSGIFLYGDRGRGPNPRLLALLAEADVAPRPASAEDVAERIWLRLIDEYLCCVTQELGERDEIDAVLREVVGTDEGPLHRLRELDPALLQPRLAALEERLGGRYQPTRSLLERMRRDDG
jgi:3-hydroxyacyl-CoA dehydrogenase